LSTTGPPGAAPVDPAPPRFSEELIERTLKVWQPRYAQPLTRADAITILGSVVRLFEVIARKGATHEAVRRAGPRQQP